MVTHDVPAIETVTTDMLFERHPQPLLLVQAATRTVVDANAAARALYGFARDAFLSLRLDDLWAGDEPLPDFDELARNTLAHVAVHGGIDGLRLHVQVTIRPCAETTPPCWLVGLQDVARMVEAEERARRSERLYRVIVENASDGVALLGPDLTTRTVGSRAAAALGFRTLELAGRDRRDLIHPADRKRFEEAVAALAGRPGEREALTYRMRDAQGRWHWLEGTLTNMVDDPDIGAFVLNYHDVTDRVKATQSMEDLNAQLQRRMQHMQALRRIDMAITNAVDVGLALDIFLEQVLADLKIDAAGVLLYDEHTQMLQPAAARGFAGELARDALLPLGEGLAGYAALEQRTVYVQDLQREGRSGAVVDLSHQRGFEAYWAVPMLAKGQLQGVIELYAARAFVPTPEWFEFLETFADQGAIAVESALLFRSLERSNVELQRAYDKTIEGWAYALDLKDEETAGHSQRVTQMAVRLARRLGVEGRDLVHLQRGALLHDIGKMGVPDSVLLKPGKLDPDERALIEQHTVYAYELLSPIDFLRPAIDIPYCHHERWDGSGYPRGLRGEQIPLAARIFAIVDVYDALTSERPYRAAWSRERTIEHIKAEAGSHFDPALVDEFLAMLRAER
jgi:PAS domain S-box-containing protein/putative nucleotidyltransferase with HDIG domain